MHTFVVQATRRALAGLPSPPDGHCAEVVRAVLAYLGARGLDAHARAYAAPNHPGGPHYTVVVGGVEYDPTVGHANWSRRLRIPRGKLYVVGEDSPHRRWSTWTGEHFGAAR